MLHICAGLFEAFDENCDGQLDLAEMVRAVGWCCRSSSREKHNCEFTSWVSLLLSLPLIPSLSYFPVFVYECPSLYECVSSIIPISLFLSLLPLFPLSLSTYSLPPPLPHPTPPHLPVCFKVFDEDGDGVLSREELTQAYTHLQAIVRDNSEETPEEAEDVVSQSPHLLELALLCLFPPLGVNGQFCHGQICTNQGIIYALRYYVNVVQICLCIMLATLREFLACLEYFQHLVRRLHNPISIH